MAGEDDGPGVRPPEEQTATRTVPPSTEERDILGAQLIDAVKEGEAERIPALLAMGANVNVQDPANGATALHYAAAYKAQFCLAALLRSGQCDYLIRDHRGLYPSEVAYEIAGDPRAGAILLGKEAGQARRTGVQAWPKPGRGRP